MLNSDLKGRILLLGIGEIGSKMATMASTATGWNCLKMGSGESSSDYVHVSDGDVLNPSMRLLRANALDAVQTVSLKAHEYDSVIVLAALGEKEGAALAPMVLNVCKNMPTASIVTMPFAYEKDRIFESGVALKRVREESGFTSIIDNESMHESNPDLSVQECNEIAFNATVYVLNSLKDCTMPAKTNIVSSARAGQSVEIALRDSLKMLYNTTSENTGHSVLYLSGDKIPVGMIDAASKLLHDACGSSQVVAKDTTGKTQLVMASAVIGATRFDSYDPLGQIPSDLTMDWDDLELGLNIDLDLRQLE